MKSSTEYFGVKKHSFGDNKQKLIVITEYFGATKQA